MTFLISGEMIMFPAKGAELVYDSYPDFDSTNLKKYVCSCGKVYSQKSSLYRHMRYECGKVPNVPCPQCEKMFKHRHHMTQHLRSCRHGDLFTNCYVTRT
ncbi:zinc finger protein 775-like [Ceratina calcarata]|uniref:Zinc finger protein 775-like n=1 Tax=Ceratina calcarata TaxID=156304 RepID=A0AAJ7WEZ8_9HYME|nr:zinc finger protein 775-like [Ceratina calcarata]